MLIPPNAGRRRDRHPPGPSFRVELLRNDLSEHCFEHIDYPSPVDHLFRECLRVLKPDGLLRLSVPDTEWPLVDYAKGPDAAYFQTCNEQPWHPEYCSTRVEHINYHFRQDKGHLYAYDEEALGKALAAAGFVNIRRVPYDPGIDSKHREIGSLFMVASKPDAGQAPAKASGSR